MKFRGVIVALASLTIPTHANQHTFPTAKTLNGTYLGTHNSQYNVDAFLGVPYAQAPVQYLRYRQPQPLNSSWTGLKNATAYGNQCVGYGVSCDL